VSYRPGGSLYPSGQFDTSTPNPDDFSSDELIKYTLGQYYHSQSPIAGHIFELFHSLGKQTR